MKPPERKYRGSPGAYSDPGDPLDRFITDPCTFHATARHYAALAGIDRGHLLDTLRLAGRHGEPVTARLMFDTATALAAGGFMVPPPPPPPDPPAVLAELAIYRARAAMRTPRSRRGRPRRAA